MTNNRHIRKKLSANDLGLTGTHQSGIVIPKDPKILGFFPFLDPDEYNPDCYINFFVPELEEFVTLRYIYYNNKLHGQGTRNEYRLTRTTGLFRRLNARIDDSIEFRVNNFGDMSVTIIKNSTSSPEVEAQIKLSNGWSFTMSGE